LAVVLSTNLATKELDVALSMGMLSFQCRDAAKLAEFWSQVLGQPVDEGASPAYATIGFADPGVTWMFVQSDSPGHGGFHPDLSAPDWQAEADRVCSLGATRGDEHHESGVRWINLLDPEGNAFDIFAPRADQHEQGA
jgi:predicted enzyme related to lactoylglutathione lyase